jgi:hypothetical protein
MGFKNQVKKAWIEREARKLQRKVDYLKTELTKVTAKLSQLRDEWASLEDEDLGRGAREEKEI